MNEWVHICHNCEVANGSTVVIPFDQTGTAPAVVDHERLHQPAYGQPATPHQTSQMSRETFLNTYTPRKATR